MDPGRQSDVEIILEHVMALLRYVIIKLTLEARCLYYSLALGEKSGDKMKMVIFFYGVHVNTS
jgi:hypothetical protein